MKDMLKNALIFIVVVILGMFAYNMFFDDGKAELEEARRQIEKTQRFADSLKAANATIDLQIDSLRTQREILDLRIDSLRTVAQRSQNQVRRILRGIRRYEGSDTSLVRELNQLARSPYREGAN